MPIELAIVPCLRDNYAYLLHNDETGETALIDAPESDPIAKVLERKGWTLTDILLTHHHPDHVDGVVGLRSDTVRVVGHANDSQRLPALDLAVVEGDTFTVCGAEVAVIEVYGHTIGHIAFHMPEEELLFSADSLMAYGCGRLFEGTPEKMWESMQKLRGLPEETIVLSGHEYTLKNAEFALTLEPARAATISRVEAVKAARARGNPTVPTRLGEEAETNPFLRADDPELAAAIGMEGADPVAVFAEVRARRDSF